MREYRDLRAALAASMREERAATAEHDELLSRYAERVRDLTDDIGRGTGEYAGSTQERANRGRA